MPDAPAPIDAAADAPDGSDGGDSGANVLSGMYIGDSTTARPFTIGFSPVMVCIKGDQSTGTACRTSTMMGDATKPVTGTSALSPSRVTSLDPMGFTIGNDASVNASGVTYYWLAFRGTPNVYTGSYTANGTAGATISVGFHPNLIWIFPATASVSVQRFGSETGPDAAILFGSTAELQGLVTALTPNGFQLGADNRVNTNGVLYHFVAWKGIATGSFAGNGTAQTVNVGTRAEYVTLKANADVTGYQRPAALAAQDRTLPWNGTVSMSGCITSLGATSFAVGANASCNPAGGTVFWAAFAR
jgi:hypothetical protein